MTDVRISCDDGLVVAGHRVWDAWFLRVDDNSGAGVRDSGEVELTGDERRKVVEALGGRLVDNAHAWQHPESGEVIDHPPTEDGWVPLYREAQ